MERKKTDASQKIISLASFCQKWRSKTINPTIRLKTLQKNIKDLERVLTRNKIINPSDDNSDLFVVLETVKEQYEELKKGQGKS